MLETLCSVVVERTNRSIDPLPQAAGFAFVSLVSM
jgi:hypothetical protein